MEKSLSEMSLKELWQLFPIILKEHNPLYGEWYAQEKNELIKIIGIKNIKRINHIGSTAIKGLMAKPTIDILLEIDKNCAVEDLKTKLLNSEWLLMSEDARPNFKLSFNKGYTPKGFDNKVFHLHVRYVGDWDEFYFRDYLIEHKDIMIDYEKLKLKLKKRHKHNRDEYTNAKNDFIIKYSTIAKQKYGNRYIPENMQNIRHDHELAACVEKWGWKYHHSGIPTKEKMPDERYIPLFKFYVSGFSTSPFGVEWMRFEPDSPIHPLIQTVPHLAFEVADLDYELANRKVNVITAPNPPSEGVRVAMIEHNGAPIELIEFEKKHK